jgi:uncharacterized protein RhaS with RHS repeats
LKFPVSSRLSTAASTTCFFCSRKNHTRWVYYADAKGSIRLITNSYGQVVESYVYDPFGRPFTMFSAGPDGNWLTDDVMTFPGSTINNRFMFTGREYDSETGLYYYRGNRGRK